MSNLARAVALVTSVVFLILTLLAAHNSAIEYDEAYNASVAKNLGLGLGYVTSYKAFEAFNPDTTTGPGLLMPMAILIKILGNKYWVPGATNALVSCAIYGMFFLLLPRAVDWNALGAVGRLTLVFSMPLFLSLCLGAGIIGFFSAGLGETGAAGCTLLGQLILAFATVNPDKRTTHILTVMGGLLLGLSLWFKLIVLLQVVPTLIAFALVMLRQTGWVRGSQSFLFAAIPCAFPSVAFGLAAATRIDYTHQRNVFVNNGSGLNHLGLSFSDQVLLMFSNFYRNIGVIFGTLTDWFAGCFFVVVMLCSLTGLYLRWREQRVFPKMPNETPAAPDALGIFLLYVLTGIVGGLGWWLFFSDLGWVRHSLPTLLALLLFITLSPVLLKGRAGTVALCCEIIALLVQFASYSTRLDGVPLGFPFPASNAAIMANYTGLRLELSPRASDQVALADYLAGLQRTDAKARFYACGWWAMRDAEYLLPGALNFQDIFSQDFADHPSPANDRYFVIDQNYWTSWRDQASNVAEPIWCKPENLVFSQGDYFVYRCP